MRKEQILNYIDVYNATPEDKRKSKIAEIADGLGLQPWEVAETLKAAGCQVNLQWFNQLKRKAMQAPRERFSLQQAGGADEKAAEAAAASAAPADASDLRKIIARQDRQLKEDAERYKALEDRAKDLANQLHEKDAELAEKDAQIRSLQADNDVLHGQISGLNAELAGSRITQDTVKRAVDTIRQREKQIDHYERTLEIKGWEINRLQTILDQYEAELDKSAERHFFKIEGGEPETPLSGQMAQEDADATFDRCLAEMLDGLEGRSAYLCGRLLEALWCWKFEGDRKTISLSRLLLRELSFALQEGDA